MEASQLLSSKNIRLTPARRSIVRLLSEHHLLTAKQTYTLLKARKAPLDRVTVYRTLDKLVESDLCCRHYFLQPEAYYELRDQHHDHFFCTKCHQINSIECYTNTKVQGFGTVDHHHTNFFGTCHQCAKN